MEESETLSARHVHITGVVQGVGFRPFVYNLATRLGVSGWVLNSSSGVEIEAIAPEPVLEEFIQRLQTDAPPLARIERVTVADLPLSGIQGPASDAFVIRHSEARPGEFQPISPDIAICDDCLRELFDPNDRRYRYPFINCTNCGPRFTIIQDIPYDRPKTTMAPFKMCPDCQAEYDDPTDRRFHAQPNACPVCGPRVWLELRASNFELLTLNFEPETSPDAPIQAVRQLLQGGAIVAIKGLGGFHLACDATNDEAVARLRERKGRVDKPFAIMSFDLATVERYCHVSDEERALLTSRERPIVLLRRRADCPVSPLVAPGNNYLGVMLPYTPLHHLLLEPTGNQQPAASNQQPATSPWPLALVMTSGNYSEEPIATGNEEALERLADLADAFLLHDRDIHARCDDSVTRIFAGAELPIRRSRGYAPYPVHLPFPVRQVLAVGAELKNTFCLTRDRYAFLSQHIGDMENYETLRFFEQMVEQLARTFRVRPEIVACDMHPGYLTTLYAREGKHESEEALALLPVQHHHAHIAACMAENGLSGERPVIGVAFDGTGYGIDGAIWGGEFLIADYRSFRRAAYLKYVPLPGGDAAIRRPYRVALAHLWAAGVPWEEDLPPVVAASPAERGILARQLERGLNTVPTSSIGRLFDAVSSLAGVRQEINYEAQAAIELEMLIQEDETAAYAFELVPCATSNQQPATSNEQPVLCIGPIPVIRAVVADVRAGVGAGVIAARFHNGLAQMVREVCVRLREETGLEEVALSGGVFQNITLLGKAVPLLEAAGFTVYTHRLVPPNDAGVSLGQAVVASVSSPLPGDDDPEDQVG
ncbi:MAG TPA: carbamoyltransferase HypF [Anaerolineales bacterium]|nr:carbamoyltransferase HypF [Anaerolineales bacterium]